MPKIVLLLALCFLLLPACAKKHADESPTAGERQSVLVGSLTDNLSKVLNEKYQFSCDEKFREEKLEMTRALDAKAGEIETFLRTDANTSSPNVKRVKVGPLLVREITPLRAPKSGWQSDIYSWKNSLADFNLIKNKPMSANWGWLNADVRSLILEDTNRVVNYFNPLLNKDDGAFVSGLENSLKECLSLSTCEEPVLPSYLDTFMVRQANYSAYVRLIKSKTTLEEKRRQIARFLNYVQGDLSMYQFKANARMQKIANGQYVLTVDPGPLATVENQIKAYVENVWRSPVAQVSLQWKDSASSPDIFRILLGASIGERSYVVRSEKTITLFPDVKAKAIAHEFGHVMGFPDHYFTVWNPSACEYATESREDDIMSDATLGVVLDEEWQDLARYY